MLQNFTQHTKVLILVFIVFLIPIFYFSNTYYYILIFSKSNPLELFCIFALIVLVILLLNNKLSYLTTKKFWYLWFLPICFLSLFNNFFAVLSLEYWLFVFPSNVLVALSYLTCASGVYNTIAFFVLRLKNSYWHGKPIWLFWVNLICIFGIVVSLYCALWSQLFLIIPAFLLIGYEIAELITKPNKSNRKLNFRFDFGFFGQVQMLLIVIAIIIGFMLNTTFLVKSNNVKIVETQLIARQGTIQKILPVDNQRIIIKGYLTDKNGITNDELMLWDIKTKQKIWNKENISTGYINLSKDNKRLVYVTSEDSNTNQSQRTLRVDEIKIEDGQLLSSYTLEEGIYFIDKIIEVDNANMYAIARMEPYNAGITNVINLKNNTSQRFTNNNYNNFTITPDNNFLVVVDDDSVGSEDRIVNLYNSVSGAVLESMKYTQFIDSSEVNSNSKLIQLKQKYLIESSSNTNNSNNSERLKVFNTDKDRLVTFGEGGLQVYDATNNSLIKTFKLDIDSESYKVFKELKVLEDSSTLILPKLDGSIDIINLR